VKVGKFDIPTNRLDSKLVEATKALYIQFKSEAAPDMLTAAKVIGHDTDKSGAFLTKIADMRSYGLVTGRGVRVTELGKTLTYDPSEDRRNEARKQALLNIPLWKELYSQFGVNLPTSNFWVQLGKIASLEAPDAEKVAENVRNAYLEDFRYVRAEKEPAKEGITMPVETTKVETHAANPTETEELKFGNVRIWLPKENSKEAWKKARKMVDIYFEEEA
jgi:hypothetical protein